MKMNHLGTKTSFSSYIFETYVLQAQQNTTVPQGVQHKVGATTRRTRAHVKEHSPLPILTQQSHTNKHVASQGNTPNSTQSERRRTGADRQRRAQAQNRAAHNSERKHNTEHHGAAQNAMSKSARGLSKTSPNGSIINTETHQV